MVCNAGCDKSGYQKVDRKTEKVEELKSINLIV